jgi:acyl-CoA thioesterase
MVHLGEGSVRFKMQVRPEYLQGGKIMQGGLIVALADEAIAHAMMTQLSPDEGLTTIELKSNFLSSVADGELIAAASVFKKGQSLMLGDCLVTDGQAKNICRVSATFMLLKNYGTKA